MKTHGPYQVNDSMMNNRVVGKSLVSRDTILTCPTEAELQAWYKATAKMIGYDAGLVWDGLTDAFEAAGPDAKNKFFAKIDEFKVAEAGRTQDSARRVREEIDANCAAARSVNDNNRAFWDKRLNR